MKYIIWSKIHPGWLTAKAGEVTILRDEAHEFEEGDERLRSAKRTKEAFQVYPVRPV